MQDPNTSFEKQGHDWYVDRYEAIRVERNRYFILMLVCLGLLLLSILANILLAPLKTAVPYLIEVNKDSGLTTVLKPADLKAIQKDQAVTVYFLYKYLNARISYDYALRQINANLVRALSSAQAYQQYANFMDTNNPESPIRRYQTNAKLEMKITSYAFPYPDIAQMHFYTERVNNIGTAAPNAKPVRQYWQATIKFAYANVPLPATDRINFNPLGFYVTNFQLNQEIPKEE
jgi:type IV secretion system protein VirB8